MPTVAQGASATLSLGPNDAYKVSIPAGGYAQVALLSGAPGSGSTELVLRDSRREVTVGPYGVNAVIRISAITGATTYGSPTTVPEDGNSNARSRILTSARTLNVQTYGNSLDASLDGWQSFFLASGGVLGWARPSGAVGGFRSDQVLAKMQADGFAAEADVVGFGEGTNDAAQGVASTATVANIKACCDLVAAAKKTPLVRLPAPSDTAWSAAANQNWLGLWLMCEQAGVSAVDPFARYVDTDGTWVAGASTDQTHPTAPYYIGGYRDSWEQIIARPLPYLLPRDNAGFGILGGNALNLTDTNADNLPDGWATLSLTGHTINPRTDYAYPFRGKRASVTVSQSAQGNIFRETSTGYAVGDTVRVVGVVGLESVSNMTFYGFVRCSGAGQDIYFAVGAANMPDTYVSMDFVVPVGTTKIQVYLRTQAAVTGAYSGTVNWQLDVINMTARRAAFGLG